MSESVEEKPEEKFVTFLTKYLENNGCKIKLKLMQSS